jgi:hypothetical protein
LEVSIVSDAKGLSASQLRSIFKAILLIYADGIGFKVFVVALGSVWVLGITWASALSTDSEAKTTTEKRIFIMDNNFI